MITLLLAAVTLELSSAARFAELALACVDREYPNKIAHVMNSDKDAQTPRQLTPAFFGCYDWHSSVHGHWLLIRLARTFPNAGFSAKSRDVMNRHITLENMQREAAYVSRPGGEAFERPYGLAWVLQLAQEFREWNIPEAHKWSMALGPLEKAAIDRLRVWLPKLTYPERTGVHSQTAFALGLMHDSSRSNEPFHALVEQRIRDYFFKDKDCPLRYEPAGQDFFSPCLAEADAMRRILKPTEFGKWFDAFLPQVLLQPEKVTDPTDGQIGHLYGLNLSRAWMLEAIAASLPSTHPRKKALLDLAKTHRDAGLRAVTGEHYEGGHWLGSYAVYLLTGRGVSVSIH